MQKQQIPLKNSLFLLLAAIILGIAFVAQSVGLEYVGGFTFSAVRSLLGSVVLIPLILISGRKNSADTAATKANSFVGSSDGTVSSIRKRKDLIIGGISDSGIFDAELLEVACQTKAANSSGLLLQWH